MAQQLINDKVCSASNEENQQPGWICHISQTYNGCHTSICLDCNHERCDGYVRRAIDDEMLDAINEAEALREKTGDDSVTQECEAIYNKIRALKRRMYDESSLDRVI